MIRLPASPLVMKALEIAERRLGMDELSRRLRAPAALILDWRMGLAPMPDRKWFRMIDLLTELDPAWIDWDEAQLPK
jgi:hypothetical protein